MISDEALIAFYAQEEEGDRLSLPRNRLEFLRTQELLRARIPCLSRILDVGGGAGVHASWLAADGHTVELIDPVPHHVALATAASARLDRGFTARVGDARALEVPDATCDVCLLLGPLYHLTTLADRVRALSEAGRVTRPGGLVIAALICRYAWPLYDLRDGRPLTHESATVLAQSLRDGRHNPGHGLTTFYSHRPEDVAAEFSDAGLTDCGVIGVEGPGWITFGPHLDERDLPQALESALVAARLCDGAPATAVMSAHLLGVGLVP